MKNKGLIFALIFGVIAIVGVVFIVSFSTQAKKDEEDHFKNLHFPLRVSLPEDADYITYSGDELLIEYSFSNYANSPVYYGQVILNNGDVYVFDCDDEYESASTDCLVEKRESITEEDLFKLKSLGDSLKKETSTNNTASDFGQLLIAYKNGNQNIILDGKGDNRIINSTKEAKEILSILKKYKFYL